MCCARSVGKFQSPILFAAMAGLVSSPMLFYELHRRSHISDGGPAHERRIDDGVVHSQTSLNFIIARARRDGNGKRE